MLSVSMLKTDGNLIFYGGASAPLFYCVYNINYFPFKKD